MFGLDVVRAAAVVLVLLSHCGDMFAHWFGGTNLPALSYGAYYGIELFFVLSGLLIGGLLIQQIDRTGRPRLQAWRVFMLRRWLRTLPLYYLWLLVLAAFWAPLLWKNWQRLASALPVYAAVLQNFAWPMRFPDFFDVSWSLAVEEWFYLGFSALLFAMGGRLRSVALAVVVALFLAGPIALRWWLRGEPGGSDHLVPYWLDSIAIGVVAAWVQARRPRAFAAAAWLLPIAVFLVWLSLNGGLARLGASPYGRRIFDADLVAVALVLLLPAACRWRRASGPLAALVRAISRTSYALYLTHLSILIYVDAKRAPWHLSAAASVALSVLLIVVLAAAMSRYVERPIMARRPDDRDIQPNPAIAAAPSAEASQA